MSEEDITGIVTQYQKYEIEYLWAVVGKHATSEGIELKMDLVSGVQANVYNLNFTIRGSYIGISDFISIIENDSALGFKIENFNMVPGGSTEQLQATFTCKNIQIIVSEKDTNVMMTQTSNENESQKAEQVQNTNNNQTAEKVQNTNSNQIIDLNSY